MIRAAKLLTTLALVVAAAGAAAPARGLEAIDVRTGETVPVLRGAKLTHLVFFATWCPECVAELPRLADLQARYEDDGYAVVLIAVPTRQTLDRLRRFREDRDPPGRLLLDAGGTVEGALDVREIPTHVLLDAGGAEVWRGARLTADFNDRVVAFLRQR